jgi:hypothetical protein
MDKYILTTKIMLTKPEIEILFRSTDIGVLDCSYMTDEELEELDEIVDKWNAIPLN